MFDTNFLLVTRTGFMKSGSTSMRYNIKGKNAFKLLQHFFHCEESKPYFFMRKVFTEYVFVKGNRNLSIFQKLIQIFHCPSINKTVVLSL